MCFYFVGCFRVEIFVLKTGLCLGARYAVYLLFLSVSESCWLVFFVRGGACVSDRYKDGIHLLRGTLVTG